MTVTAADIAHMARALRLARQGLFTADPNPRVGCVITDAGGVVVGEGYHRRAGEGHAEVVALASAGSAAAGGTAYVTLEPCSHHGRTPPCAAALIAAGLRRVVYACDDPNPLVSGRGARELRAAGIEVVTGVLANSAEALNVGFMTRMRTGMPWVRAKLAVSLDGRTALANGMSQWITGAAARADVHRWRAQSSAVLTGSGTVLADDPRLTSRLDGVADDAVVQPLRVVVDSRLRTPVGARVLSGAAPALLAHCNGPADAAAALTAAGADVRKLPADESARVDLRELLSVLAAAGCNEVLVEAGPRLNGALLEAGLVDELIVYQASTVLGADARGMFDLMPLSSMAERRQLQRTEVRIVGDDLRLRYRVVPPEAGTRELNKAGE
ncbi:MAG: bifunctional diaminohydroxyphosphoribosylaminopyrimidine deaminase/5-amino-6-(5-phosphoribosylamino)uracil reductase RibD [Gammaproteobacteria bacterium]|jgi:diaminohydroxyphosphoribosylaminopyrimidine deaminase/5-amino-6-(5-phosphoribosylamino)uracil reductase|nr:bifunctional diaminohydroxyphosphoribosylaminopyrimidine deaminase/5-amino-6-(5-phosphoribosylamino)uracil reductase RibD [Gammaproteobacteria bacterium]